MCQLTSNELTACYTGYCFLLFQDELSVQSLIETCLVDDNKYYWCVSSPTMKDKPVSTRQRPLAAF